MTPCTVGRRDTARGEARPMASSALFPLVVVLWVASLLAVGLEVVHGAYLLAALALPPG